MNPPIWLIYNRGGNTILIQRGKDSSINRAGEIQQLHGKESNWTTFSHYVEKITWIRDLNLRPKTIKLLEKNTGSMLFNISGNNIFFGCVSSGK